MSDIKLFKLANGGVEELQASSVALEKSLQILIERHLEAFLGVRFLASEHSTGQKHGGRIDTLGLDENGCPVIIEYKRTLNENVINQGLFYLDWLLDHKADFTLLVMRRLGQEAADAITWSATRLLCIAGDFSRYDEHAIAQINRNIELIRYRRYGDEYLLFELVNATRGASTEEPSPALPAQDGKPQPYKGFAEYLDQAAPELRDRWEALKAFLLALGDDVTENRLKYYTAFKRIKNFACVEIHPQTRKIALWVKVDPTTIQLEPGFTRDVTNIGHFGTGDLEISILSNDHLERAKPLILRSYEAN